MNPTRIYHENGQLRRETWSVKGKDHRFDGPAGRYWDEEGQLRTAEWRVDGKLHRIDGPAYQRWYKNGKLWYEEWWIDGKRHRVDGPAWQEWDEDGQLRSEAWDVEDKQVQPISDPLEWALFIAKTFGNTHGLEKFCYDNLEDKAMRAILASSRLL